MKTKRFSRLALVAVLVAPLAAAAQAGGSRMRGGRPIYDLGTVTTLQGNVVDVARIARRNHEGVHLILAMGSETLSVHLGPAFYVDGQPVKIARGDTVEVIGSRVTLGGKPVIVAREVRRGADVLALRDASGAPLWRGQGASRR
jgi:hypothetical protein